MERQQLSSTTIREIVTTDYRTAEIFEKYSLDFCCNGGVTVASACALKGIDSDLVISDLLGIRGPADGGNGSLLSMELDGLIDHIVATHHAFVVRMVPVIYKHTQKVAAVHGERHPEVIRIAEIFKGVAEELIHHMKKEEVILFPYIIRLVTAHRAGVSIPPPPFGSANNPIAMMEREHREAGDGLYQIRELSGQYTPPKDACTTYRVTYQELQEFEQDLHRHVHLENNILFPASLKLEKEMFAFT